jgi:hypothetical protein
MMKIVFASGVLLGASLCCIAGASGPSALGPGDGGVIISEDRSECSDGELFVNHDYSFETAYCWHFEGIQPPYYGCHAEAFDLGPGYIACGAFWATQINYLLPRIPADVFVWDGGITCEPGNVLILVPGAEPWPNICHWPSCCQNDVEIMLIVAGEFTAGYWADFSGECCEYYCAADLDGAGGHPWTCIAPGQEWPSGWQDPSVVFGPTKSMGIGVYFEPRDPSSVDEFPDGEPPSESPTWGQIKALFRR